jgi:hypothetical protein
MMAKFKLNLDAPVPPPGSPDRRQFLLDLVNEAKDLTGSINSKINEIQSLLTEEDDEEDDEDEDARV